MLKDRGIRRTGKEGADNKALTGGAGLCGPDYHFMQAKMELSRMDSQRESDPGQYMAVQPNYWVDREKLYGHVSKLEKRKNRGGATFSPKDAC